MANELTLEQWQQYLLNARNALHDPNATPELRHEAAAAIEQATAVLNRTKSRYGSMIGKVSP